MKLSRVPVDFNVRCGQASGNLFRGRALNLSTGGIFIITSEPVVLGERLSVEFLLPSSLTPINIIGETVWCRSYNDQIDRHKPPHVAGIKFIDVPKRYERLIQNCILEMLSSKSPVVPGEFSR